MGRSKESLSEGRAEKVKVKVSLEDSLSQKICTMLTCVVRVEESCRLELVRRMPLSDWCFHLLHKDQYL